jgi:tetratricopeptide (TPR) repeat protein
LRRRPWQPNHVLMRRALAILLLSAIPSLAQTPDQGKRAVIDRLLEALKTAPDEGTATVLEAHLAQLWLQEGTPAVTLLMSRGMRELAAGASKDAIEDFGDAATLDPDLAAAWRERAEARYAAGDVNGAVADLEQAVQHEPRDFLAFRTLTNIATAGHNWKAAYEAWQKVLAIDPKTQGGERRLRELHRRAFGEET